ncbi:hypothetical protein L195_g037682 [Trifolium pratense]|uniref:Uncharacterized protein n=1 Tax=Trifolium pratense TaxID=57577 RepID=A0A2K3LSZ2_TRIPR|nr:hypothetical protein L195_g037682 [Trifolium pratense]
MQLLTADRGLVTGKGFGGHCFVWGVVLEDEWGICFGGLVGKESKGAVVTSGVGVQVVGVEVSVWAGLEVVADVVLCDGDRRSRTSAGTRLMRLAG